MPCHVMSRDVTWHINGIGNSNIIILLYYIILY